MRLTRQTEIAIAVLVACAKTQGRLLRIKTIARHCTASKDHTAQITNLLTRLGWLESYRGRSGGVTLAERAKALSLGEIVRTFQPERRGSAGSSQTLDHLLQEADRSRLAYLDRFTIADLADDALSELCPETGKMGEFANENYHPTSIGMELAIE